MFFIVIPLKNSKLKTFYPWRIPKFQAQNPLPLKNSKLKTFNPWRIPSSKPFTAEEFQAQNPLPLKNSKLKTLYPWRIPSSKPFTPEEFQGSSTGGVRTDIKWNSPMVYIVSTVDKHSTRICFKTRQTQACYWSIYVYELELQERNAWKYEKLLNKTMCLTVDTIYTITISHSKRPDFIVPIY
jgi:hypothetical protein